MEENWKDIKGFEGLYKISNFGNVKSLNYKRTKKERILTPGNIANGYLCVLLYKNGTRKTFTIHRLVAQTFIENPENLPQVNHIDEDKTNNRVENLEWCDIKYNNNYGTRLHKMICTQLNRKDLSKAVLQFDLNGNFIKEYCSLRDAARSLGNKYFCSLISRCSNGIIKTAYGYKWKYKED